MTDDDKREHEGMRGENFNRNKGNFQKSERQSLI